MAMTKEGMAAKILAAMASATQSQIVGEGSPDNTALIQALCKGIIEEITTNSEVTTNSSHVGKVVA